MTAAAPPSPRQYRYNADPANKPKLQARSKVAWAVESGNLVRQPCKKCGATKSQAHHDDYSKPLEVQWLCSLCHGKEHRPSHCKRGHPLTNDNVVNRPSGGRACRRCAREYRQKYWKIHKRTEWRKSK